MACADQKRRPNKRFFSKQYKMGQQNCSCLKQWLCVWTVNVNINKIVVMHSIFTPSSFRALVDVVFEWFGGVVPKIGLNQNIAIPNRDSWIKTICRRIDWKLLSCKFTNFKSNHLNGES
jgi:hypothetical protein